MFFQFLDEDIKYMEKFYQNKKFKYFRVFTIHISKDPFSSFPFYLQISLKIIFLNSDICYFYNFLLNSKLQSQQHNLKANLIKNFSCFLLNKCTEILP